MKRVFLAGAVVLGLSVVRAEAASAPTFVDKLASKHYLLTVPDGKPKSVPLLVTIHGMRFKPEDDRAFYAAPAEKAGWALANVELAYADVKDEKGLDDLWGDYETIVADILATYPQIDPTRIYLAGTSRGGMYALALALRHPTEFRAVGLASASYLILNSEKKLSGAKGQAFFFVNGDQDDIVPIALLRNTKIALRKNGATVGNYIHAGAGHQLDPEDYAKLVDFMVKYGKPPVKKK